MLQPVSKVEAYQRAADWLAKNGGECAVDALEVGEYRRASITYDFVGLVDLMRFLYSGRKICG